MTTSTGSMILLTTPTTVSYTLVGMRCALGRKPEYGGGRRSPEEESPFVTMLLQMKAKKKVLSETIYSMMLLGRIKASLCTWV